MQEWHRSGTVKPTERQIQEAKELLRANVARNREIKEQYPLEL